jgi:hypothetical protein
VFAPIYLPPAGPVPASVLAAERAILAAEGPHHVAGRYIADARLAAEQRRMEAASIVAAALRLVALYTPVASVPAVRPVALDGSADVARRAA